MSTVIHAGKPSIRLVALASLIGTSIEWYDFFLYNTAAALVFNKLFFPTFDPFVGTMLAFSTYAVGFAARPIGAIVIGHYGDKVGRKSMLVLTLMMMGIATCCIGLLPTYESIGPWAAVLLIVLRLVQGFGVGGQWGRRGADGRRARARRQARLLRQLAADRVPAGLLTSTIVFSLFSRLPPDQFMSWGWRIPFLLSIVLVGVGLMIRLRVLETPAFTKMKETKSSSRRPVLEVLQKYPKQVLQAAGMRCAENGAFYIYSAFMLVYATQHSHIDRNVALNGIMIASACEFIAVPAYGALTDRIGRRPVYMFGRDHDGGAGVPAVLVVRHGFNAVSVVGASARVPLFARADVRTAGRVLFGALRHERPLQWRLARGTAFSRRGRRILAADRDGPPSQVRAERDRGLHHPAGDYHDHRRLVRGRDHASRYRKVLEAH